MLIICSTEPPHSPLSNIVFGERERECNLTLNVIPQEMITCPNRVSVMCRLLIQLGWVVSEPSAASSLIGLHMYTTIPSFFKINFILCIWVLCLHLCTTFVPIASGDQKGLRCPGTEVIDDYKLPCTL